MGHMCGPVGYLGGRLSKVQRLETAQQKTSGGADVAGGRTEGQDRESIEDFSS